MKARIKQGAPVFQDHGVGRWPACKPPNYMNEVDPDMVFECEWKENRYWNCRADGFGSFVPGERYGNGSIFVTGLDQIEPIEDHPNA